MIFASENNVSPSSMMGHSFIKLSGKNENGLKEHSFSYFATVDVSNTLKFYADILTVGIDGAYVLSPYAKKRDEYMQKAEKSGIHTDIEIALPDILYIDSIDLCSIIGNILENAITACMDIPKEKR